MTSSLEVKPSFCWILSLAAVTFSLAASAAYADDMYIWAEEAGGNVTFFFQGSVDTTGLPSPTSSMLGATANPMGGSYLNGAADPGPYPTVDNHSGSVPPGGPEKSYGTGGGTSATSTSGDAFGFIGAALYLPENYISGTPISGSMSFAGESFASMGVDSTPKTFNTTGDLNTFHLMVDPNQTAAVNNAVAKAELLRQIRKLKKKIKKLKKKGKTAKAKKLGKKVKMLTAQLEALG